MSRHLTVSEQILEVMRRTPDCRLDDLVLNCRGIPLKSVLFEVSRLSREGQLQLTLVSMGSFTVQLLSMNCRPRLVRSLLTRGETMKKENAKSQKGHSDQRSGTARKWDSARVPQPSSVYLTCSEAELEALMLKGEPS
jgi:hypothetical protein